MNSALEKESIFVNFSNHPSGVWSENQMKAALTYAAQIVDLPFPPVDPAMDEAGIDELAERMTEEILAMKPAAVMCQGEFGLSFSVIRKLLAAGAVVLYGCSKRKVHSEGNFKTVQFDFVRFRRFV